jgi:hypothetical protein
MADTQHLRGMAERLLAAATPFILGPVAPRDAIEVGAFLRGSQG